MIYSLLSQNPLRNIRNYFNTERPLSQLLPVLFVIIAVVAAVLLISRAQQRRSAGRLVNDPRLLYRTVIRQLRLSIMQRDILNRMARDLSLDNPALIFLSPSLFAEHAQTWLDRQSASRDTPTASPPAHLLSNLDAISRALFATSLPRPTDFESVPSVETTPPSPQ